MTDATPKKKQKLLLPVLIGLVVILVVGFLVSRAGLDKELVKRKLDETIAVIKEKGRAQGRDIDIRYGELEVAGGTLDKQVIVHQPVLTIKPLDREPLKPNEAAKPDSLVVTSEMLVITPKSLDMSSLLFSLPKPVDVAAEQAPQTSLLKIESNTPIEATVTQKTVGGLPHTAVTHALPTTIDLIYLRERHAEGVEDAAQTITPVYETLTLTMDAGGLVNTEFTTDGSLLGAADVALSNLKLIPKAAPEGTISVATVKGHWSNALNENNVNALNVSAEFGPVSAAEGLMPSAPLYFGMDFGFEGVLTKHTKQAVSKEEAGKATINLKKLTFTSKDAGLSAQGMFSALPSDMLPVGSGNIKVTNVPATLALLRSNGMIEESNEGVTLSVLEKAAGAPLETLTDVDIPIQREKGGQFVVGKTTFEEIMSIVLQQMMRNKMSGAAPVEGATPTPPAAPMAPQSRALVPQIPAATKPRSAPIELRDQDVRG